MEKIVRKIELKALDVQVEDENNWSVILQATVSGDGNIAIVDREVVFKADRKDIAKVRTNEFGEAITEPKMFDYSRENLTFSTHVSGYVFESQTVIKCPTKPSVVYGLRKYLDRVDSEGGEFWSYTISVIEGRKWAVKRRFEVLKCRGDVVIKKKEEEMDSNKDFVGSVYLNRGEFVRFFGLNIDERNIDYNKEAARLEVEVRDKKVVNKTEDGRDCLGATFVVRRGKKLFAGQQLYIYRKGIEEGCLGITDSNGMAKTMILLALGEKAVIKIGDQEFEMSLPDLRLEVLEKRVVSRTEDGRYCLEATFVVRCGGKLFAGQQLYICRKGMEKRSLGITDSNGIVKAVIPLVLGEKVAVKIGDQELEMSLPLRLEILDKKGKWVSDYEQEWSIVIKVYCGSFQVCGQMVGFKDGNVCGVTDSNGISKQSVRITKGLGKVFLVLNGLLTEKCVEYDGSLSRLVLEIIEKDVSIDAEMRQIWDLVGVVRQGDVLVSDQDVYIDDRKTKKVIKTDEKGRFRIRVCIERDTELYIGIVGFEGRYNREPIFGLQGSCNMIYEKMLMKMETERVLMGQHVVISFFLFWEFWVGGYGLKKKFPICNKAVRIKLFREKMNPIGDFLDNFFFDPPFADFIKVLIWEGDIVTDNQGRAILNIKRESFGSKWNPCIEFNINEKLKFCSLIGRNKVVELDRFGF